MRALLITADGFEILTDLHIDGPEYTRERLTPAPSFNDLLRTNDQVVIHRRTYKRIDTLRGHSGELAVYREEDELWRKMKNT